MSEPIATSTDERRPAGRADRPAGPTALQELAAAVRPAVLQVRRRLPEIVVGVAVLFTVLSGLALVGGAIDDAAIDRNPATSQAEVLEGSTFFRTVVRFTVANGQAVVPERGVFNPRGVSAGDLVPVEYDVTQPDLVRIAGTDTAGHVLPMLGGVVATWAVLGPLAFWLRRRRRATHAARLPRPADGS